MTEQWSAPATATSVSQLRNAIVGFARQAGMDREASDDLKLAVSEALTNAVLHAYRDGGSGDVAVLARRLAGRVEVLVEDRGVGLTPRPDSPGIGVGLPLIATLAVESSIVERAGGGTSVRMLFALERPL
jgi:anti-sigma regulatory factor (Ser/Thr protein kinase)